MDHRVQAGELLRVDGVEGYGVLMDRFKGLLF
jgi:hypothetical protein